MLPDWGLRASILVDRVSPYRKRWSQAESLRLTTLAFQAVRIAVNNEFGQIKTLLEVVPQLLLKGGRFVCISFHSSEDKLVAKAMRAWQGGEQLPALHPEYRPVEPQGVLHTRKALTPSPEELAQNQRARSARMRVFEFYERGANG